MAITEDTQLLLIHMKKTNELTQKLLDEKRKDDTPTERAADSLPEVAAEYLLTNKEIKSNQEVTGETASAINEGFKQNKKLNIDQNEFTDDVLLKTFKMQGNYFIEVLNFLQQFNQIFNLGIMGFRSEMLTGRITLGKTLDGFATGFDDYADNLTDRFKTYHDEIKKSNEDMETPSQRKESKKEEQTKLSGMFASLGETIGGSLESVKDSLGNKLKTMNQNLFGKIGLTTVITVGLLLLFASVKRLRDAVSGLALSFGALFQGDFAGGFTAIITTGVLLFRKFIINKLFGGLSKAFDEIISFFKKNEFGKALKSLGKVILRFALLPLSILLGFIDFISAFNKKYFTEGGSFLESLGAGIMGFVKGFLDPVMSLLEVIANAIKFGVDFVAGLLGFDVPTGGQPPLARGRNFGGRNPNFETQTVDATGSLAVAGTGGNSSVNVFNMGGNVVDASSKSESHTHTNTNITDVEAENTGL